MYIILSQYRSVSMNSLIDISNGKYKQVNKEKLGSGAFSNVYDVQNTVNKIFKYVVKHNRDDCKYDAVNEIESFLKIKKNRKKFREQLQRLNVTFTKSNIITLKDYYIDGNDIYSIYKKYTCTIEDLNIQYNKFFNQLLPTELVKKFINSMFLALYELYLSGLVHCDIKPDNIMVSINGYNNLNTLFKDIKKKKLTQSKFINITNFKLIDFNKVQKAKSLYKSTSIHTLYYTAPEVILGNRNYNYTVDLWAMCCIIHEVATSMYLFDVHNENIKNKFNFKNYESDESDDEGSTDFSTEDSSQLYRKEDFDNFALLHIYKYMLGENNIIQGDNVEIYYINGQLMGTVENDDETTSTENLTKIVQLVNNSKDKEFYDKLMLIFIKVFIYDYNKRLTIEEIISKYMF